MDKKMENAMDTVGTLGFKGASYSLNSLKGGCIGGYIGDYYRGYEGGY